MSNAYLQWTTLKNSELIENDVLEIGDGYRAKNSELGSIGLPFARAGNIDNGFHFENADLLDEANVPKAGSKVSKTGDVVFTSKGTVGRFAYVKHGIQQFVYSPQLCYWRVKDRTIINPRFLFYWMHSLDFTNQVHQVKSLTDMADYVSLGNQRRMKITVPPLPTQCKIAAILSAYDDLIENNTRRITILEEMAQSLYKEWFVHFRFPGNEKISMVESALGMIPEGWEVRKLGDICLITMGQSPSSQFYNTHGDGLPFHQGVADFGGRFPTDRVYCVMENRIAEARDILFSVRAPVGRINIANKRIVIGRGLSAIRSKTGNQMFVFQQLKELFQEEDSMGNGAIFKSVTKDDVYGIKMIQPSQNLISAFEQQTEPVFSILEILTNKNANLRQTRDLLLPKLIAGEIDVEEMEVAMGDLGQTPTREVSTC
jgi:type I restriction enzyme S subunit